MSLEREDLAEDALNASFSHAQELLLRWIDGGQPLTLLDGVRGDLRDLLFIQLQKNIGRPFIIITPREADAEWMGERLRGFLEHDPRNIEHYPLTEVSPYQTLPANRLLEGKRLQLQNAWMSSSPPEFVVLSARSLDVCALSPGLMKKHAFQVGVGDEREREEVTRLLVNAGYCRVPTATDPGDYSVRGSIVDIYTTGANGAVRVDFFGDEVDSIRALDPETQRSGEALQRVSVPPAREALLSEASIGRAKRILQDTAEKERYPSSRLRPLLDDLDSRMLPQQLELFPGLFAEHSATVRDFVPAEALWVIVDPQEVASERIAGLEDLAAARNEGNRAGKLCPPLGTRILEGDIEKVPGGQRIECPKLLLGPPKAPRVTLQARSNTALVEAMRRSRGETGGIGAFVEQALSWQAQDTAVMVVCRGAGGLERLAGLLEHHRCAFIVSDERFSPTHVMGSSTMSRGIQLYQGSLSEGFQLDVPPVVVIAEDEIFGKRTRRKGSRRKASARANFGAFDDLCVGGHVVHLDHGVARYEGLVRLTIDGVIGDYLDLRYRDDNKLFLPVIRLNKVQRYVGSEEVAPLLDKLGGTSWERTRARVREDLWELAEHLIATEARRKMRRAASCGPIDEDFRTFEAGFAYEPTEDQDRAIDEVMLDLEKETPMDRLVCGDVGFGKTEVALRAAYRVVQNGGQVAVLVPTTILAEQHLHTFRSRMEESAAEVRGLSRFRTGAETTRTLEGIARGTVDVVVGTHRLIGNKVQFRNLQLVIVDEEHRFGVRHKEKLKELKESVHVLTLTATPIPRTLHFALAGLRELSTIATPPRDRLAVHTLVHRQSDAIVEEAIRRELKRGGQVFYIHNRVATIETCAEHLGQLVPEARIVVGHGKMPERRLEKVMRSFIGGESNVLVSTTIVENGLDIPNANTLLVERSDRFGLADLYQLRGRVGRGPKRAYAYFMIPSGERITGDAASRLEALRSITGVGGGFQIAQRDLEIRGAGNILGKQQSGQINAIGYELYAEMLEEALATIQGSPRQVRVHTEMQVSIPAFISEDYCPETRDRLRVYKELGDVKNREEVDACFEDLVDRAGRPEAPVKNLFELARLRLIASDMGIARIEFTKSSAAFEMSSVVEVEATRVIEFLGCTPGGWRMSADGQSLLRPLSRDDFEQGVQFLGALLETLRNGLGLVGRDT